MIGELAKATDTKVETIRYYEQIGLLPPAERTTGNYRAYAVGHLKRLSFIRRSRDLGFSIEQVRALLSLADQEQRPCNSVDELAREHLAEVDAKIADLRRLRTELASIISRCSCGTIAECRIIDALGPRPKKGDNQSRWKGSSPQSPSPAKQRELNTKQESQKLRKRGQRPQI